MTINIEKILAISATEWFKINKKEPTEYEVYGIHCEEFAQYVLREFVKKVPTEAEIVVNYGITSAPCGNPFNTSCYTHASGTALIPKK